MNRLLAVAGTAVAAAVLGTGCQDLGKGEWEDRIIELEHKFAVLEKFALECREEVMLTRMAGAACEYVTREVRLVIPETEQLALEVRPYAHTLTRTEQILLESIADRSERITAVMQEARTELWRGAR